LGGEKAGVRRRGGERNEGQEEFKGTKLAVESKGGTGRIYRKIGKKSRDGGKEERI